MGQPKITLYVDIISPFGYIAYWMLRNSPTFTPVSITYVPILLGGLHKQCNNTAPIFIKNKDKWINRERTRWASLFQIPIREDTPPGFPVSTVGAMRVLTALELEGDQEALGKVLDVFWAALWCPKSPVLEGMKGADAKGEYDVKSPDVLKSLISGVLGAEKAEELIKRANEKDVKDRLVKNTGEAFEKGAFGLPWFQCVNEKGEEEGFWGFDHLGQVVRFLGLSEDGDVERSGKRMKALL